MLYIEDPPYEKCPESNNGQHDFEYFFEKTPDKKNDTEGLPRRICSLCGFDQTFMPAPNKPITSY
jgi:hypothetical protein